MLNKFFFQLIIFLCLFFGSWFLLSKINYSISIHLKKFGKEKEQQLGKLIVDNIKETSDVVYKDSITEVIDTIKNRLYRYNHIDTTKIEVLIVVNKEVNAFALPGNTIIIYTGLIEFCDNPEELASVLAHETAHIENNHITKKLSKEIGISILIEISGGNASSGIIKEVLKTLSSTAFDRRMEEMADTAAVRYMAGAKINPTHFADLLFRLSKKSDLADHFEWISTHPGSRERTAEILKLSKKYTFKAVPFFSSETWQSFKKKVTTEEKREHHRAEPAYD
jgi:beta-barrel assembly-enhancing protease